MTETLLDLSEKSDPALVQVLNAVSSAALYLNIPFFIVGAIARDLILKIHEIEPRRATLDLDLAVRVRSWEEYEKLVQHLTSRFGFKRERPLHRFSFNEVLIDILPFGTIANDKGEIHWPKDQGVMSVIGFDNAYDAALTIRFSKDPLLEVRVSSLPGLAILKLVAWDEKYPERDNDAKDILLIMQEYDAAGNTDRLYEEEPELLREEGYDNTLAAIRLLGRDMAAIADEDTLRTIFGILRNEEKQYKLASQMISPRDFDRRYHADAIRKIHKLIQGLEESL